MCTAWPCDLWRPSYNSSLTVWRFHEGFFKIKTAANSKKGKESWHFEEKIWFCLDSSPFFKFAAKKRGKNLCKTNFFPKSVRILSHFLNLPPLLLEESCMKSQNCQAWDVTWPSKVARPRCEHQRIEGKLELHPEWPPGRLPEQNFTKIQFLQTFITQTPLFFRPTDFFMPNVEGVAGCVHGNQ